MPIGSGSQVHAAAHAQALEAFFKALGCVGTVGQFARGHTRHPVANFVWRTLGQMHNARHHAEPCQPTPVARSLVHCHQNGLRLLAQQFGVSQGTGRDHANHLALHRPLAGTDFSYLFANGDRLAVTDQFGQVAFHRMKRHTRHRNRLPGRLAAGGKRDVQNRRRLLGIGIEHLVEISHSVKQQCVRMLAFEGEVLLHHGGVLRHS